MVRARVSSTVSAMPKQTVRHPERDSITTPLPTPQATHTCAIQRRLKQIRYNILAGPSDSTPWPHVRAVDHTSALVVTLANAHAGVVVVNVVNETTE
jgi:hypothetical protein